jgi:hypothetical protein
VAPWWGSRGGVTAAPFLFVAAACTVAACSRQPSVTDAVSVAWTITPSPPVAGAATLAEVTLRDGANRPLRGARLQVEAFMTHPGMAPEITPASERDAGVYQIPLRFTMRGNWILLVTGTLPDGRRIDHRIDVHATGPSG